MIAAGQQARAVFVAVSFRSRGVVAHNSAWQDQIDVEARWKLLITHLLANPNLLPEDLDLT